MNKRVAMKNKSNKFEGVESIVVETECSFCGKVIVVSDVSVKNNELVFKCPFCKKLNKILKR